MMTSPVQAEEESYVAGFGDKLGQGVSNLLFGFVEIPKNIINISNQYDVLSGLTWGLVRGIAHGITRTFVGAGEILTSPFPTYDFATPAYVWDRMSEDSRYIGLNYPGYWTTYGPLDDGE
jgi:putative exosortase-associated protein (TIGR04073 family)